MFRSADLIHDSCIRSIARAEIDFNRFSPDNKLVGRIVELAGAKTRVRGIRNVAITSPHLVEFHRIGIRQCGVLELNRILEVIVGSRIRRIPRSRPHPDAFRRAATTINNKKLVVHQAGPVIQRIILVRNQ